MKNKNRIENGLDNKWENHENNSEKIYKINNR